MTRTIVRTAVADILRNAAHSVDLGGVDWFEILAAKVSHDHFDWLCDEIMDKGFVTPIVIEDGGEENWTIGNGHHRLCAAILLGLHDIPVIFASSYDWVEDSHDGDHELPSGSFEYWEMLRENMEGIHYGDTGANAWRAQYNGESYDDVDDANACDYCGECASCCGGNCQGAECDYCPAYIDNGAEYSAHLVWCPERDYEYILCGNGMRHHYRFSDCDECRNAAHVEALSEHVAYGYLMPGAWHPVDVLTEAYDEHAERVREATRRAAQEAWHLAMANLRDAAARGIGDYGLVAYAEMATDAMRAYEAL